MGMLEFIKIAYLPVVPLLLLLLWTGSFVWKKNGTRILAVLNLLLIGNSVFVIHQMLGLYYLVKSFNIPFRPAGTDHGLLVRMVLLVVLPLLSLHGWIRKNIWYTVLTWIVVYSVYPWQTWSVYQLPYKIAACISLFSAVYGLLWLLKKLPYQQ